MKQLLHLPFIFTVFLCFFVENTLIVLSISNRISICKVDLEQMDGCVVARDGHECIVLTKL